MHLTPSIIAITIDVISMGLIAYVIYVIKSADAHYLKSNLTLQYERFKRDKIFQKALLIVLFSMIFSVLSAAGEIFGLFNITFTQIAEVIHTTLFLFFVIYLLNAARVTIH
jgi:hypothetical protein